MKKILPFFLIFLLITSCAVLPEKNDFYTTSTPVELGSVGEKQKSIRKTTFQPFGIPVYKEGVRVNVLTKPFTKSIYKNYKKSIENRGKGVKPIIFKDTLKSKPLFIEIAIEDKVGVVSQLNKNNIEVFNYFKKTPKATIVSKVRMTSDNIIQSQLQQADVFYLKTDTFKKQWLHFVKDGKEIGKINVSQNSIFEYELSSFCWKKTKRGKIVIATITNEGENCSSSTKRNTQLLEEELNSNSFNF